MKQQTKIKSILAVLIFTLTNISCPPGARADRQSNLERYKKAVEQARKNLQNATDTKESRPDTYIRALLSLSSRLNYINRKDEAMDCFDKALDAYGSFTPKSRFHSLERNFLGALTVFDGDELDKRLDKILRISEKFCKDKSYRRRRDNEVISTRFRSLDQVIFLTKLIEIRKELYPSTHAPSYSLYRKLASVFEGRGKQDEAVDTLKQALKESLDSKERGQCHTHIARIYLRQKKFDAANREWKKAGQIVNWDLSGGMASSFAFLATYSQQQGDSRSFNEIVDAALQHPNPEVIKRFDKIVRKQVQNHLEKQEFDSAEKLIQKRINSGKKCSRDEALCDWQMQLSELYYLTGRKEQSEKLYKKIKVAQILKGESAEALQIRRAQFLRRAGDKKAAGDIKKSTTNRAQSVQFPYALYAFSSLSLNGNTSTGSFDSSSSNGNRSYWRTERNNGDVCSPGKVDIKGNTMVNGSIYGTIPTANLPKMSAWLRIGRTKVVKTFKKLPKSIRLDGFSRRIDLDDHRAGKVLKGGDYNATSLSGAISIAPKLEKPVRIFVNDKNTKEHYAVRLRSAGSRNLPPENLQIWYQGYRPIDFQHNSHINAIVYAPYSTVTMGDNNCTFNGAIIADKIKTIGNVRLHYDLSLKNKTFVPSKASQPIRESVVRKEIRKPAKAKTDKKANPITKELLAKYPAIEQLNLLTGPIVYREITAGAGAPVSARGMKIGDRFVSIEGPNSIVITGNKDTGLTIILDGQTLTDKAMIAMDKGRVSRAQELLTMALRANPDSASFGYLAECWYHQEMYDKAIQACAIGLKLSDKNVHATALKAICKKKLNQKQELSSSALSLLKKTSAQNKKDIATGLSCLALNEPKKAKDCFSMLLKENPKSWRIRRFKNNLD